jgi:hypothetical protein
MLGFCLKVPWTVRSEAQLTWTVRSKSTTWLPRVHSYRHQQWYGPMGAWHVADDATWTNQVIPHVNFCHVACWVGFKRVSTNEQLTLVIRGSPAHSRRNFPGCWGSSASDTVWSSKSQSEQSCGLERQMKKKALSRNKKPGFHTRNRGNTKITNLTRQTYFFTIYHFDVGCSSYKLIIIVFCRNIIGRGPVFDIRYCQ